MTLVKLRLNLKFVDLAFRFNISTGLVSGYFNTWICFLYHHLKETDWMPKSKAWFGSPVANEACQQQVQETGKTPKHSKG